MRRRPRGTALPIVLWALIALSALSIVAAVSATLDWSLARNHRDHAAALALAEAGLAQALAGMAAEPPLAARTDSVSGALEGGTFRVAWQPAVVQPAAGDLRVLAHGSQGGARRTVEAWISSDAGGALRIAHWREVR